MQKDNISKQTPLISIITICYNEPNLEMTCKSICNQTYQDFEWIVIDGGSNQETLNIFEKYKQRINVFVSEKDNGIYNAQNKGTMLANGKYLLYMNAGDFIFKEDVLENVIKMGLDKDFIYGNSWFYWSDDRQQLIKQPDVLNKETMITNIINHQAMFIKKELFIKYGLYNEKYRLLADYDRWMNFVFKHKCSSKYIDLTVAHYDVNGVSAIAEKDGRLKQEMITIQRQYFSDKTLNKIKSGDYIDYKFIERILSKKNTPNGKHSVLTLLGVSIKFKRKKKQQTK